MAKHPFGVNLYKENNMAERSITEMLSPTTADPDATLVDVFGLKSKPADDYFKQLSKLVGSIQQTPEPALSEQELMDIAIGSAFPGAGVGASIRGGKQALGNVKFLSKYWDMLTKSKKPKGDVAGLSSKSMGRKNINILKADQEFADAYEEFMKFHAKAPKSAWKKAPKPDWKELIGKPSKLTLRESLQKKNFENIMDAIDPSHPTWKRQKLSSMEAAWLEERKIEDARKALKAIQKKYKIADPDKQEFVDTITALLTGSRN